MKKNNGLGICPVYWGLVQNIVLFGHSMGGWVCLKALQELPTIKKGFVLSTWDIVKDFKNVSYEK